jgi:hypothetical protein
MTVIVVLVVVNNELADVGHMVQELDNARIEAICGWDVLVVVRVEEKSSNMKTELGCVF